MHLELNYAISILELFTLEQGLYEPVTAIVKRYLLFLASPSRQQAIDQPTMVSVFFCLIAIVNSICTDEPRIPGYHPLTFMRLISRKLKLALVKEHRAMNVASLSS